MDRRSGILQTLEAPLAVNWKHIGGIWGNACNMRGEALLESSVDKFINVHTPVEYTEKYDSGRGPYL